MDLESYICRYTGETRLRRLISIARQQQNEGADKQEHRAAALDLAEQQMKRDGNVQLYRKVFGGGGIAGTAGIIDPKLLEGKFCIFILSA